MHLFKKEKQPKETPNELTPDRSPVPEKQKTQHVKKIKIGFGHKKPKKNKDTIPSTTPQDQHQEPHIAPPEEQQILEEPRKEEESNEPDLFPQEEELLTTVETPPAAKKKDEYSSKKKKTFSQKNMEGKPVYLEDTGEKLGTISSPMYDAQNNFIGYKIKDQKTDTILSFSLEHFDENKDGLIFIPSWYVKSMKTIEKLEFKDRISPEITTLLVDNTISSEELYNIFLKHDDEMAGYMEEASALKELLHQRLQFLEKQRLALKDNLMDLTERRLIKDVDRKQFSEDVMEHRRRVNILDVNIKKCKELLGRLDKTSFGMIRKQLGAITEPITDHYKLITEKTREPQKPVFTHDIELPYKQKYYQLKDQYEQLEENYNELKIAVEKLLTKSERREE